MTRSTDHFRAAVTDPGPLLLSGEVQFWRMDPRHWATALSAVKDLGIDHVATYLSWRRHEPNQGRVDFRGRHSPELDVHRFLGLCADLDLSVQLKPGPWICAEEPGGGFPDWVLADSSLMALDHTGAIVSGYNPPFKHPMPSYASRAFRLLVGNWYSAVWTELADYTGPDGPIVATQLDNEPSLGFQDSMYGFDYHPESLEAFDQFVSERGLPMRDLPLPRPGVVSPLDSMWMDYQVHYISNYLGWLRSLNHRCGVSNLIDFVNLNTHPVRGMPQSGRSISGRLALPSLPAVVGEDHYFVPPVDASDLAGLALAAAQGAASSSTLVWAPEIQSGIWRSPGEVVSYADPTPHDLAVWWGAAIAVGYQGFNLYMLVDRENWEFAPISPSGELRPVAGSLRRFLDVVRSVDSLATYRPVAAVNLIWDESARRRAYRVTGTQSNPSTEWDDSEARSDYHETEQAAAWLTKAGIHFALCSTADDFNPGLPTVAASAIERSEWAVPDDLWIEFNHRSGTMAEALDALGVAGMTGSEEVFVRLHRAPAGQALVMVVSLALDSSRSSVELTLRAIRSGNLVDTITGERWKIQSGKARVEGLVSGLTILRIEDAGDAAAPDNRRTLTTHHAHEAQSQLRTQKGPHDHS